MRVEHDSIAKSDGVVGRARTTEPDGLRVLWNGQVLGHDFKQRGFIAGNRRQFAALWRKVHPPRDEPAVDLSKYVVLAVVGMGSICPTEVMGVRVDAQDVLRLEHIRVRAPNPSVTYTACSDVGVRRALVLAVPRTLLSSSVTFVEEEAFEFSVPKPGEPAAEHQDPTRAQTGLSVPRGESVELPVRGSITLRTLSNGAQVWVAHQRDGSVNVLSSLISRRDILDRIQPYESIPIAYSQDWGRFHGYDSRGQSVHGFPQLPSFSFARVDDTHIVLGGLFPARNQPIQSPEVAPTLVGDSIAYRDLPIKVWDEVPPGHVARVNVDLVVGSERPPELCQAPGPDDSLEYFRECPAGSPTVQDAGEQVPGRFVGAIHYGPFVLQRNGKKAFLIRSDSPNWRDLPTRPPERCPLEARSGNYPGYRIDWTGKDGPEAYHQLCEAPTAQIIMASAIVRGTGTHRIGDALSKELEPYLAPLIDVTWGRGCDGSVAVILRGDTDTCPLDPVIETIGKFLRERDASDRIIVRMGLRAAPAL